MSSLADISIVVAPMLSGFNKGVMDGHTLYVAPEVYNLMGDSQEILNLVLKHLKVVTLPRGHALSRLALMCLKMKGDDHEVHCDNDDHAGN